MAGVLFLVVGASGVGKDTLLDGARAALAGDANFAFARRTITRPANAGGEDHRAVTPEDFAREQTRGAFLVHWTAHGLHYGLPITLRAALDDGQHVIANGSRAAIPEIAAKVENLAIIEITAPKAVIEARLAARGREDAAEASARLARQVAPLPAGVERFEIANDADVATGVARLVETIRQRAAAEGRAALAAKIEGRALNAREYRQVIGDIVAQRYEEREVTDFLVAASRSLSDEEILALARARAEFANHIRWDDPIVVDKHSLGGIPGGRITLILVPIVAAHGLAIPKTSSRAITSAAGTADAMETLARVDLDINDVRRVVDRARGCVAWNGKLNHTALDDVMNAITRPRGLDSTRWSVASILSKKLAAGSTHVIIDLPYGARAKLKTEREAQALASLFERIGAELGLSIRTCFSDGRGPIGDGIGPALEVRDCLAVLDNDPQAPSDLREKALAFAARILAWDPAIGTDTEGRARAEHLLASGAAREALDRIVEAQGRTAMIIPAVSTHTITADRSGTIADVDGWVLGGLARDAGAPRDKGAGIYLLAHTGDRVRAGDPLYRIHANASADLAKAAAQAQRASGYRIVG